MNRLLSLFFFAILCFNLNAGSLTDYQSHIATDRLIVIFDKNVSIAQQDAIIKNSGLVSDYWHLPHPRLTVCVTGNLQAAQNYFSTTQGVNFVSFFITDGLGHYGGVMNDFFIKINDRSFEPVLQAKLKALGLTAAIPDTYIPNLYKVNNTLFKVHNTVDWCALFQNESWVQYASPNYLLNPEVASNDPDYTREWQIHNTGSALQGSGTPGADMKVDTAWGITTGDSTIKIGLIDSGTDTTHADLKPNLLPGHDAVGDSTNGYPTPNYPDDGHGTCTAGILAAVKDNGIGVAGVAPGCKVIPVRAFYYISAGGTNIPYSTAAIFADAIGWAWDTAHADVLSNSWGITNLLILDLPGGLIPVEDAIRLAHSNGRGGKGISLFFSSGNDNDSAGSIWPGYMAECISVGATNQCDTRKSPTDCSHDAWGDDFGGGLQISAPGENIPSTDMMGAHGFSNSNYYFAFSGTSAACPNAAAVGALMLSVNPQLTAEGLRNVIEQTCDRVGGYAYDSTYANGTWCRELGFGRVNAYRAVKMAQTYTSIPELIDGIQVNIFPNPTHDAVNIQYDGSETAILRLYDLNGHLVASQSIYKGVNVADVSVLAGGVYLARIEFSGNSITRKLVVYR